MLSIGIVWFLLLASIAGIVLYVRKHPEPRGRDSRHHGANKPSGKNWSKRQDAFFVGDPNMWIH
jgi:hypothetical protein